MCNKTCGTCKYIGIVYHRGAFSYDHICLKSDIRRKEGMSVNADFFDHFRAFFDAQANQKSCNHYEEREVAPQEVINILLLMEQNNNYAEFEFFSEENGIAEKYDRKFWCREYYYNKKGFTKYKMIPLGKSELERYKNAQ